MKAACQIKQQKSATWLQIMNSNTQNL